jgi:alpha-tubulin suppressor-like RCC1 family protein
MALLAGWRQVTRAQGAAQVYTVGYNFQGELGDGMSGPNGCDCNPTPEDISVLPGSPLYGVAFTALAAGSEHSLAVGSNGHVYAWGNDAWGQLGNGTNWPYNYNIATPEDISVIHGSPLNGVTVTALAAGNWHSLAVGSNGHVYAWGENENGQLGDGTTGGSSQCAPAPCTTTPEDISILSGSPLNGVAITAVAATATVSMALGGNGHVYTWGDNRYGTLGNGTTTTTGCDCNPTPEDISVLPGSPLNGVTVVAVTTFSAVGMALGSNGHVYTWGGGSTGELGDGRLTNTGCFCEATPEDISAIPGSPLNGAHVIALAAGGTTGTGMVLASSGNVYTWGDNDNGQMGDGTVTTTGCGCKPTPEDITENFGSAAVTSLAVGLWHSLAVGSNGHVYSWGDDTYGELGNGTTTTTTTGCDCDPIPEDISVLPGSPLNGVTVTKIAAGGNFTLAQGNPPGAAGTALYPRLDLAHPTLGTLPASYHLGLWDAASSLQGPNARSLATSPGSAQQASTTGYLYQAGDASPSMALDGEFLSAPLAAQTIPAGAWSVGLGIQGSLLNAGVPDYTGYLILNVINGSTGQVRGTLVSAPIGAEKTTEGSEVTAYQAGVQGGAVMVQAGDYLEAEIGVRTLSYSAVQNTTLYTSGTTAIATDGSGTSSADSFIQAPITLTFQ